ncbi:MAG: RcnB family protein [Gammaproteobacteria bacterium]|uniref:RcnB family protein n=1 Tax=Rhodoferax sp. TaxID=50421 RepID=UPI0017DFC4B8|nr:RcnB family protein [Rhodoferax sp.]MBU3900715.1 RcnB family protein [Gammaproteobacteria bacterium]MBA3056905.1 RcnB family protein [Rhodoferax sp.]MBU3997207.1 RcnB family protein [Gammaproteobacteria bacterium]MBU4079466.1 RcnB family protein [Gammaproteobacteria bacterium]MBU4115121.1 RcnB family protein [Gammaproteobacteria bacterium]
MKNTQIKTGRAMALLLAGMMATAGAMAEKPEWAGGGKQGKQGKPEQQQVNKQQPRQEGQSQAKADRANGHFRDDQRTVVRNYFSKQYSAGRCPPGLAKKNNGCMPPGQARKWAVGQPLPRDLVTYSLPTVVIRQLGAPPAGQRYVRVASDILLIAVGTGMVVDAIQDLGRL